MNNDLVLTHFLSYTPENFSTQEKSFDWIIDAHLQAEKQKGNENLKVFEEEFKQTLLQVGCKPGTILKRYHILKDFLHTNWEEMEIYKLHSHPQGVGIAARQEIYEKWACHYANRIYEEETVSPDQIIHVSCTGYTSPSAIQKQVSKKGWHQQTTVTHVYHMGCYASIPAIRLGFSLAKANRETVDIVHTEFCTLHMNPSSHRLDQLVAQSLFGDGVIHYKIREEEKVDKPYLIIKTSLEQQIPQSEKAMVWSLSDFGFQFFLSKEIPSYISRSLKEFLRSLCLKGQVDPDKMIKDALFAIHPGGPKLIDYAEKLLGLKKSQLFYSREILANYGNISSCTLPHIWELILKDESVKSGTPIISMAFGPGLTIAGLYLEKG